MPDLLEQSTQWLEDQRDKHLAGPVIYQRGGDSAEVTATIGRSVFAVDNGEGAAIRTELRDYLIRAAHLVLGGQLTLPRPGDQVHEMRDGVIFIYQAMAPGGADDEPVWQYSDPYRLTLRIHTRQVDQKVAP
jgi:hypothetical protein